MSNEGEFYDKLFEKFYTLNGNNHKAELWKNQQIMEIMSNSDNFNNSHFVQNALIVIMALFDNYLKDSFFLNSKNFKKLNHKSKQDLITILEDEIFY